MKYDQFRNRRGGALVFVSICAVVLIMVAALVIDIGRLYVAKQRAQNVADAAAIAGAWRLDGTESGFSSACDEARAVATGNNNAASGWQVTGVNPTMPVDGTVKWQYTGDDGICTSAGPWKAIQVDCRVPVEYTFAKVMGKSGASPSATAIAIRQPAGTVTASFPPWAVTDTQIWGGELPGGLTPGVSATLKICNPYSSTERKLKVLNRLICLAHTRYSGTGPYIDHLKGTAPAFEIKLGDACNAYDMNDNLVAATNTALTARGIVNDANAYDSWKAAGYPETKRIVILPIVAGPLGNQTSLRVLGYTGFFIESFDPAAGTVTGRLVNGVATAQTVKWQSGGRPSTGANLLASIRLVK